MRAVRPGATEHGPQGRAQCRDWAGGRMRHGTGLAAAGGDLTSLRYGEIMGLRRKDFALRDRKVKIDRAHIQPDTGPKFDGDPKAHSGRTVSLPAFLVPEVKAHLAEFVRPEPDAYVFLGPKGARPARSNFHIIWNKARRQAGVAHLHLHDLRHTGNTLVSHN